MAAAHIEIYDQVRPSESLLNHPLNTVYRIFFRDRVIPNHAPLTRFALHGDSRKPRSIPDSVHPDYSCTTTSGK